MCENAICFYEFGLRPHVSSVFSSSIRKFMKTLSRVETLFPIRIRIRVDVRVRKFANTFTSFSSIVFTASIINKHGVQGGCSFFVSCSDFYSGIMRSDKCSFDYNTLEMDRMF